MKLQYKLSGFFSALLLISGIAIIIVNSELLSTSLEQTMLSREKIGIELLEKRIFPYLADKDYAAVTGILFEEKGIKKGLIEYIVVHDTNKNVVAHTFLREMPLELRHGGEDMQDFYVSKASINGIRILDIAFELKDSGYSAGIAHIGYRADYIDNTVASVAGPVRSTVIIVALFAIFLGFLFSRRIVEPINSLVGGMDEVGRGNMDVQVSVKTGDELESLANSFNTMIADLKESGTKVEDYSRNMEEKVNEKTRELKEKMDELMLTKNAVLNIMEDTEELNRSLAQAQENLKENVKELKITDVKKNEFMSIAAHELKTPMTSIHGFAQLLQDRKVADDPEKRDKYLKIMDHETIRLAKLVNDVLDLSRMDLNAITFDIVEVDINGVMDLIKTEMDVQMKAKGLEAEYAVAKDVPKIFTDRERFTQVLLNLINNSVKYTPKGKITVNVQKDGGNVHFIVKDTGIGISKENVPKIFTRFYQVDSSYTRSAGGVGLGLSLCKEMIERLGGKIWFESEPDKGSEFHFTLPIKNESAKPDEKQIAKKKK